MNQITNYQPTFRWNRSTHHGMTLLALEDINIDMSVKRQIARYSQMPDFSHEERGYHCNAHFFYPLSNKSSFGKNSNKNNALDKYKTHFNAAILAKNKDDFLRHTGYALHFLQDVTVPLHTEAGGFFHKLFNYLKHLCFEKGKKNGATANLKKLTNDFKKENIQYSSYINLFFDTALFSQNPEFKISLNNKQKWLSIQQKCFDKGTNVSRTLLEKMIKYRANILST